MRIRRAVSNDNLILSALCADVQRLHAKHHPEIFKMPSDEKFAVEFFEEMLTDAKTFIYIAEDNGQALGYIVCQLTERPENPFTYLTRFLHIDQISVRPSAQGQGIGAALIKQAEITAKELEIKELRLDSWNFNTDAHVFFEKAGFQKYNHRFWRNI